MLQDYVINVMKQKPEYSSSSTDETLSEKLSTDQHESAQYLTKQDSAHNAMSVHDFYSSCAVVLEGNNSLLVSLYDENKSRLDGVLERFVQAETRPKGYLIGGDPGKVFDVLGTFREYDIPLRGGYFDFYTGRDVDVHQSLSEERFSDMLKQFLDMNQGLNLITNDIYDNRNVDDPSLAQKSIDIYTSPRLINVFVSDAQYESFSNRI